MKIKVLSSLVIAGALSVSACQYVPDSASIVEEQLVAVTQYDVNVDYAQYATFSASDYVAVITGYNSQTGATTFTKNTGANAQAVINATIQNMTDRGYTYNGLTTGGDMNIQFTAFEVTNVNVYYPGWWWYDYPYYPYYPYPYAPVVSTYSTGSLVIDIVDKLNPIINPNKPNQYPIVWTGLVRGLLDGSHTTGQVTTTINECFAQTPDFGK